MDHAEEQGPRGFDLVLKELISFQPDVSNDSNRTRFDRVLREFMAEREKAAVEKAVATATNETTD